MHPHRSVSQTVPISRSGGKTSGENFRRLLTNIGGTMGSGVVTVRGVTEFHAFVRRTARERFGEDSDDKVAHRIGTTGKTVGGWKDRPPAVRFVIEFARQYGVPIPEALMLAYDLSADELGVEVSTDPARISDAELIMEVARRLGVSLSDQQRQQMITANAGTVAHSSGRGPGAGRGTFVPDADTEMHSGVSDEVSNYRQPTSGQGSGPQQTSGRGPRKRAPKR